MKKPTPPNLPTLRSLKIEQSRRHLIEFTRETFPEYRPGWFHKTLAAICESVLDDIAAKKSPRVILSCPPQHGKSELISRRLPAFALGRDPNLRIIATSYSADRALDFSSDVQRIMDSPGYHELFPGTRLVGEFAKLGEAKRTASLFQIVGHRGRYRAAGVQGGISGEPADLLLCDDLLKDFAEACSETVRDSVYDWLTSVAFTRLQAGAGVILIGTRWHMSDPIGRLIERQPGRWQIYNFAALAEQDEPPYRLAGEALTPELHDLESLIAVRDGGATSTYQWTSLYQGHPSPLGGGIFKREDWQCIKSSEFPTKFSELIQSWDCAFRDTRTSDYVVGQVWGKSGAGFYLVDQVRARMNFPRTLEAIRQVTAKWPAATRKLIEARANGDAIVATLKNEIPGLVPVEPIGGKESRAHACSSLVEAHNVYLGSDHRWTAGFIEECAQFPGGTHDDQVDACTQALNYLRSKVLVFGYTELVLQEAAKHEAAPQLAQAAASQCPKCGSPAVNRRGPLAYCGKCGAGWRWEPAPPPQQPQGQRRGIYSGPRFVPNRLE